MSVTGRRIGYVRVGTLDQNEKRQLEDQVLGRVFTDKASSRDTARPQLAHDGDTVVVHSMDRHGQPHAICCGAFAEFERSLIRDRQRERIALAKQRGAYKGRKKDPHTGEGCGLVQRADSGVPKVDLARDAGVKPSPADTAGVLNHGRT